MGHTKGPWRRNGNHDGREIAGANGCVVTMTRRDAKISTRHARANAHRIVDCVNACEGIADPSVVPELVEVLAGSMATLLEDYDAPDGPASQVAAIRTVLARARGEQS